MKHVLLSGWAQPADALLHLAPDALAFDYSLYGSADEAIKALKAQSPSHIIAWSLGGQLALRALAKGALRLKHLTLIAAPMQFVSDEALKGMDATTYQLFRDSYASDPIRAKARLHALIAKGDREMKQVMAMLSHHAKVDEVAHWLPWLEDLAAHRLDDALEAGQYSVDVLTKALGKDNDRTQAAVQRLGQIHEAMEAEIRAGQRRI